MTAAQQAKAAGLASLKQVSDLCGRKPDGRPVVSVQTLNNWHRSKPLLFALLIAGASVRENKQT